METPGIQIADSAAVFEMRPIPPHMVDTIADQIVPMIDEVRRRSEAEWSSDDVLRGVREGRIGAYRCLLDGRSVGILAIAEGGDIITGERCLHPIGAYALDERLIDFVVPWLENFAVKHGYTRLSFASPRKGWTRRLRRHGWKVEYLLVKEIDDG